MKLKIKFYEGISNLWNAKLRSFLALLGILVGTASVVAMVSGGNLATRAALQELTRLGTNLLSVSMYQNNNNAQGGGQSESLSLQATQAMPQKFKDISAVGPYTQLFLPSSYDGHVINSSTIGVTQSLQKIMTIPLLQGRFISDLDGYSMKCVIGNKVYQKIRTYTHENLLGKQVQIGKQFCTIVGILKPWLTNSFFYTDLNSAILLPIKASQIVSQYAKINNIVFRIKHHADIDKLKNHLITYINSHTAGSVHIFFMSPKQLIASAKKQSDILTLFLAFIASISLLVGGVGVMNIMLVSVVERRREIGIRKAVGAKSSDIVSLFLIESTVLSLTGGVVGVTIGIFITYFIALYKHWQFTIFLLPIALGFCVSVLCGIFFGLYPAYKASKLDPIQALHSI